MKINSSTQRLIAVSLVSLTSLSVSLYATRLSLDLLNSNQPSLADRAFNVSTWTFIIGAGIPWILRISDHVAPANQTPEVDGNFIRAIRAILTALAGLSLGYLILLRG